ncbi:MAG: lipase family protein [Fusobacteriaceae bacterium]
MGITKKEYLLMSLLGYFNFTSSQYGKYIYNLLKLSNLEIKHIIDSDIVIKDSLQENNYNLENEIKSKNFKTMKLDSFENFINYFYEELNRWKIFQIEDRRPTTNKNGNKEIEKTGFYAISFTDGKNIVISFRGSETFPFEEAYKDFIENNLVFGIGRRPKQFSNALDFYYKHVESLNIEKEKISLTGHSLGGGIAQFVALHCNKKLNYIPETYTWNAVGINREGIITFNDFIEFDTYIKNNLELDKNNLEILKSYKDDYFKVLRECELDKIFNLENILAENVLYTASLDTYINKIYTDDSSKIILKDKIVEVLFKNKELKNKIIKAKEFFLEIKENKIYKDKIINYGHSKDLTNGIFKHVGELCLIDAKYKNKKESSFVKTLFTRKKHILTFHFEDVFIPYILTNDPNKGEIGNNLNLDFIASSLRQIIYKEKNITKKLLKGYYSYKELEEKDILNLKTDILEGINKSSLNTIYTAEVFNNIKEMENSNFLLLWKKTREKLSSPYYPMDVYDSIIY